MSATTTQEGLTIQNIDLSQYTLHAGSRIKIAGSYVDSIYTVSRVYPTLSGVELLETIQGLTQTRILEVIGSIPQISTEIVKFGSSK